MRLHTESKHPLTNESEKNSEINNSWMDYANISGEVSTGYADMNGLTFPMLELFLSKAQGCKDFWKSPKPCHVGIHWKTLAEYSQMSTHMAGF